MRGRSRELPIPNLRLSFHCVVLIVEKSLFNVKVCQWDICACGGD